MEGNEASERNDGELDQLQAGDTLIDRGVDDVLDEGYILPDNWGPGMGYGTTAAEMRQGESIDMRAKQEEPEHDPQKLGGKWNPLFEDREVGKQRAGRLVVGDDHNVGREMGISGGAASAEEAAMHIIDEDDETSDD
ncbi:DUF5709 domain-containing protein [uncultured Tessaracoccus sp.]|uniref:DUF5709 domain-containing protein n=1 Tax=uncultured Tessaracoccus sp. TaxID=905023 RepID=UPI002632995C|nr:DUF5709 domain-containing protein [uncultured Tessaracoccus sp.]